MRYIKRYLFLTLILLVLLAMQGSDGGQHYQEIESFRGASIDEDIWNPLIVKSINNKKLKVSIDNREYSNKEDGIYVDNNFNVMLPVSILGEGFVCSARMYPETQLVIEKSTSELVMQPDAESIKVNGQELSITSPMTERNGEYYVSMQTVAENIGFSYEWNAKDNVATAINNNTEGSNLPYRYDYREKGRVPQVRDQGSFGTCWAFASLTALESALMPEQNIEFSPDHMSMNNSFTGSQNDGGEYTMGMAYLTAWQGPVLEEQDVYGDGITTQGLDAVKHVQEVQIVGEKDYNAIKEAVFRYGGVQTSLYSSLQSSDSQSMYYNRETSAYCYMGTEKPNHDVVIIGWDDSYPRTNFSMNLEGDGAFICQNSWGSNFGDNGVFYVSYYDTNIGIHNVVYTGVEEPDNYDHIYQTDLCGWVGQLGYNNESIYGANVYTATSKQNIGAAGFYATGANTSYELYIVRNFKDTGSFDSKLKVAEGSFANAGYYTVAFDKKVSVEKDERFAIVLKIRTPGAIHPLAIEYIADENTGGVDLSDGEGYICSVNGNTWENVETTQQCNLCIKVYSKEKK